MYPQRIHCAVYAVPCMPKFWGDAVDVSLFFSPTVTPNGCFYSIKQASLDFVAPGPNLVTLIVYCVYMCWVQCVAK